MHKNKMVLTIVLVSILLCVYAATLAPTTPEEKSEKQPTFIAILPFSNQTGDEKLDWLKIGLQDALTIDLYYLSAFQVKALPEIVSGLSLTPSQIAAISIENIHEIGQKLYADAKGFEKYGEYLFNRDIKKIEEAIQFLEKAVESDESYAEAWNNLGWALYPTENYDKALASWEQALKLKPYCVPSLVGEGIPYRKKKEYKLARNSLEKAVALNPSIPFRGYLGFIYSQLKGWELALREYTLIASFTQEPEARFEYLFRSARILFFNMDNLNTALSKYAEALKTTADPEKKSLCLIEMGLILLYKEDLEGALTKYEEALKLAQKPETKSNCLHSIGKILETKGNLEEALARYEEALKLTKNPEEKAKCLNSIGTILETKEDLEGALVKFEEALSLAQGPDRKASYLFSPRFEMVSHKKLYSIYHARVVWLWRPPSDLKKAA